MNWNLSYLYKTVAKLKLNGSRVEITVDFVMKGGRKDAVFNSACNIYTAQDSSLFILKSAEFLFVSDNGENKVT